MLLALSPAGFAQITKGAGTAKYEEKLKLVKNLIGEMTIDEKIDQLTNVTQGIKRLGIKPYNWWSEVLHGVARNLRATESLQLYVSAPTAGVASPIASLIVFKRVELQPGQTVREKFAVTPEQLQTVLADGRSKILEGSYAITVGGAAPSYRGDKLGVSMTVAHFNLK